jgi:hypothetical protein
MLAAIASTGAVVAAVEPTQSVVVQAEHPSRAVEAELVLSTLTQRQLALSLAAEAAARKRQIAAKAATAKSA